MHICLKKNVEVKGNMPHFAPNVSWLNVLQS